MELLVEADDEGCHEVEAEGDASDDGVKVVVGVPREPDREPPADADGDGESHECVCERAEEPDCVDVTTVTEGMQLIVVEIECDLDGDTDDVNEGETDGERNSENVVVGENCCESVGVTELLSDADAETKEKLCSYDRLRLVGVRVRDIESVEENKEVCVGDMDSEAEWDE
jgi:hypothetical protein